MVTLLANPLPSDLATGVLLVEGIDDKHMVWHLCGRDPASFSTAREGVFFKVTLQAQSSTFQIMEQDGRPNLLKAVSTKLKGNGQIPFGIVIDADDNLEKTWNEVVKEFDGTSIQLPPSPDLAGTIIPQQGFNPKVGIWLMPDNQSLGELEDFALPMIRQNDTVWPRSHCYIESVPKPDRKFAPDKINKAKVHAWLATKKEPGRLGAAVSADDLDVTGPLCKNFLDWLTRLFG